MRLDGPLNEKTPSLDDSPSTGEAPTVRDRGASDGRDSSRDGVILPNVSGADEILSGGGELGARMRATDWTRSPLGPPSSWPQSLRTCVRIILTSRQPMFVWWGESLINLYNDAYKSILGGKHPEALGKPAHVVWHEIWEDVGPRAAATIEGNEGTYDEALLLIMERNGYPEETYYTFSYSPVPHEDGGTGGLICANTDDTRRIIGERQLALLREQAAQTVHARTIDDVCVQSARALATNDKDVPFALIYLADADGRGVSLVATSGLDRGHPVAPPAVPAGARSPWPFEAVLATKESVVVDLDPSFGPLPSGAWTRPPAQAIVLPLGSTGETGVAGVLVVGLNPYRLFDDAYRSFLGLVVGQIASSIATAHAYQEEKRRREALAEIDRAKTAFFSNVSHEFRTPLTLMLAPIEDMRSTVRNAEERERVELLHRNAQRLLKLVNSLLEFSRIEAGRVEAAFEPTDLAALTVDLASSFRSAMNRAGLTLIVDCPPLREPFYVDRGMWEKVVLNLLSNAFKFTFEGSVTVRLSTVDGDASLEVSDTGTGIPNRELPRIFERFHRIDGARSRSHEGSGIGLALVHELVRMHGGQIDVKSREGEGTTFSVRLPRGASHLPKERIRSERALEATRVATGAYVDEAMRWISTVDGGAVEGSRLEKAERAAEPRARIVFVDDNADMRDYVTRLLREHWDVEAVGDGQQALAAIRRDPPDLILSDVMMPGLDGFGLVRAIRNDAGLADTPLVLISARAGEEATAEGLSVGADDYIVKPFTARELLVRVTARLTAARLARQMDEQRKKLYRHFMQAPFTAAVLRGPSHVVELANDLMLKALAKGPEIVGLPFKLALPELDGRRFVDLLDGVYRTGVPHEGRGELARLPIGPAGALVDTYWNYVYVPLFDPRGAVEGVMISGFDVTEQIASRQRVEAAHAKSEALASVLSVTAERLEVAQSVAGIGIFDWDLRLGRLYWSPEVYALMGHAPGSIQPTSDAWTDALAEEDREAGWSAFRTAAAARKTSLELELRLRQPGGGTRWIRLTTRIVYDDSGAVTRVIGAIVDVQALKETAEAERSARARAEEAARLKDEFLATLSHELRTPLNAILGWTAMLRVNPDDAAMTQRGLAIIQRNAQTQTRLVSDLLDVSRIVSGKLRLSMKKTEVAAAIQSAADVVKQAADAKGVNLIVNLHPDVGSIVGDPDRLQQIVWNLLSNAVRFTPAGGSVTTSADRTESVVRICVVDTGAGIPPEHLPYIFERFRQVDSSTTRAHGGLGLGLAIVRHLVEAHGGTVSVASDGPHRGARFTVFLPVRAVAVSMFDSEADVRADGAEATPTAAARDNRPLHGLRILVVEDDADSLELVRVVLEGAGASIVSATSARQALEAQGPFHAIVSDIGLPEIDGYELIRRMRARPGACAPAIALTAYARLEDASHARSAGYQEHIAKPVNPSDLIALVDRLARQQARS